MTGLDTNVLARYYLAATETDAATTRQHQAARRLLESGQPLLSRRAFCSNSNG